MFEFYLNVALILLIQITKLEHTTGQKKPSAVGYKMGANSLIRQNKGFSFRVYTNF